MFVSWQTPSAVPVATAVPPSHVLDANAERFAEQPASAFVSPHVVHRPHVVVTLTPATVPFGNAAGQPPSVTVVLTMHFLNAEGSPQKSDWQRVGTHALTGVVVAACVPVWLPPLHVGDPERVTDPLKLMCWRFGAQHDAVLPTVVCSLAQFMPAWSVPPQSHVPVAAQPWQLHVTPFVTTGALT
jgi:hypothetical protein